MSERRRILSKAGDYTEKSAKIERRKRGDGWDIAPSPYEAGRFIVFRYNREGE